VTAPEPVIDVADEEREEASDDAVDFGFDFLEEEDQADGATKDVPLGEDDDDKPAKGPEFAF
jgi:hypothetical protein